MKKSRFGFELQFTDCRVAAEIPRLIDSIQKIQGVDNVAQSSPFVDLHVDICFQDAREAETFHHKLAKQIISTNGVRLAGVSRILADFVD